MLEDEIETLEVTYKLKTEIYGKNRSSNVILGLLITAQARIFMMKTIRRLLLQPDMDNQLCYLDTVTVTATFAAAAATVISSFSGRLHHSNQSKVSLHIHKGQLK